jgi:hypothetical protein
MTKKTTIAGGIAGLSTIIALTGILSVKTLCACTDANTNWSLGLGGGAQPMKDDPDLVRGKLLERLPLGSSISEINKFLAFMTVDGDREKGTYREGLCVKTPVRLSCKFPVKVEWWGYHRTGFNVYFMLDGKDRLTDARISPYSNWFGDKDSPG